MGGCLAYGCYRLKVTDSGSNGITDGGYVLKSQNGDRIVDCTANFSSGALSQVSGSQGGPDYFCVGIGTHKPIFVSRDKLDWVNNEYFVASENAAISQVWTDFGSGSPERANTGYDFWFFDPNGNYTFVRQRRHSVSDGFGPASATRACHMKINSWTPSRHIPATTLMNVRIRTVLLGVASEWGPAYQFKIDPLRAQCPLTHLLDIPNNPFFSCGQTRSWGSGNYVHAQPINGANKYQFRFKLLDDTFVTTRNSNNYFLHLNWGATPLVPGTTYKVDVRASFDGGTSWCSDFIPPALDPWGDVCTLTIASSLQGDVVRMDMEELEKPESVDEAFLLLWPNPSTGGSLDLRIGGIGPTVDRLDILVLDAMGRGVFQQSHAVAAPLWNGTLSFDGTLPAGAYVLMATAGEQQWTERWVVGE